MSRHNSGGFTLIELLIVVAIIGIIAAIAIPNLLNAIDRGKQKRTMADIRSVGTAVESYSIDNSLYPTAGNMAAVQAVLEPAYIKRLPLQDGWNHDLVYQPSSTSGAGYTLMSLGKDGISSPAPGGRTSDLAADIIFVDGQFTQWPEGMQR